MYMLRLRGGSLVRFFWDYITNLTDRQILFREYTIDIKKQILEQLSADPWFVRTGEDYVVIVEIDKDAINTILAHLYITTTTDEVRDTKLMPVAVRLALALREALFETLDYFKEVSDEEFDAYSEVQYRTEEGTGEDTDSSSDGNS